MKTVTDIPITAKFRMGVKDNMPIAHRIIPKLDELVIKKKVNVVYFDIYVFICFI
jgi:tRNA-dihydrouridine synthase